MTRRVALALSIVTAASCTPDPQPPPVAVAAPQATVPAPPWPAGDERGMANAIGPATYARCAPLLADSSARAYELSYVRSATMPLSPFAGPYAPKSLPTNGLPGSSHGFNIEVMNADANPAQQGTQMDAFGHFGRLPQPWDGTPPFPADSVRYYGGFTQKDVKPTSDSPLLKLGMDKVPPIITSAVLLDAKQHVGGGTAMKAGELVTATHLEAMVQAQGLSGRGGILPGDAVLVHTGWSERYADPDVEKAYYAMAPGLSDDALKYLVERRVVIVGLDTPFVDAVAEGKLGQTAPSAGAPTDMAFPSHQRFLVEGGVHTLENPKLDELVRDKVWTSCVIVLPLREKGAAGSPVRPVAVGVPAR